MHGTENKSERNLESWIGVPVRTLSWHSANVLGDPEFRFLLSVDDTHVLYRMAEHDISDEFRVANAGGPHLIAEIVSDQQPPARHFDTAPFELHHDAVDAVRRRVVADREHRQQ